MLSEVQKLKVYLNYSLNNITEVKNYFKTQQSECTTTSKEVIELKSKYPVKACYGQTDYLDNHCPRNNLMIDEFGQCKADETLAEIQSKVKELFATKLKMNTHVKFESVNRNGKVTGDGEKPSSVVIKSLCWKIKRLNLEWASI